MVTQLPSISQSTFLCRHLIRFSLRADFSATVLVHQSALQPLLKASGIDGLFNKIHKDEEHRFPLELHVA